MKLDQVQSPITFHFSKKWTKKKYCFFLLIKWFYYIRTHENQPYDETWNEIACSTKCNKHASRTWHNAAFWIYIEFILYFCIRPFCLLLFFAFHNIMWQSLLTSFIFLFAHFQCERLKCQTARIAINGKDKNKKRKKKNTTFHTFYKWEPININLNRIYWLSSVGGYDELSILRKLKLFSFFLSLSLFILSMHIKYH